MPTSGKGRREEYEGFPADLSVHQLQLWSSLNCLVKIILCSVSSGKIDHDVPFLREFLVVFKK